ncbi:DNA-processing protein DprA [Luteimonas sp. MC1895]|uniref:DNA-processing protein DprA n=1 Tax=Luteimonas sp. MC1895 TaxID=2819513 RepID=UPI0018F07AE9|nr:DNA-processing protein DprA [Luteimonas sp. MC1895]MBJ6979024.1 DNA-protecting protein DprA [Luteimonas sp. MC1895]
MDSEDIPALLRVLAAGGRGEPRRLLLESHGSAAAALRAGPSAWRAAGLDPAQRAALMATDGGAELTRWQRWLEGGHGRRLVGIHHPDYPSLLARLPGAPLALWVLGDAHLLWHPAIAVVGSRAATAGGLRNAYDFARSFAEGGLAVTSGLAAGIDTAAHEGALAASAGRTVAVLGTAIDQPYPRRNAALYARIAESGAVVSELPPGTAYGKGAFPSRNRIVMGLSLGVLVVEAALRSGAAITARLAGEAGREVFAVPGSIHNPKARGCHRLIRDGAGLVETPSEVLESLTALATTLADDLRGRLAAPIDAPGSAARVPGAAGPPATPDHQRLWQALGHDPTGMDELVSRTGLTAAELGSMLLLMELEGRVEVGHGRYSRKSQ